MCADVRTRLDESLVPLLLAATRRHVPNAFLQTAVCMLLVWVGADSAWRARAIADGALEAAIEVISYHSSSDDTPASAANYDGCRGGGEAEAGSGQDVLRHATTALLSLTKGAAPAVAARALAAGAAPAVIAAMRVRRSDEDMQTQACVLLSELVVRSSNPATAVAPTDAADAMAAAIAAMDTHVHSPSLQHRACYALGVVWPAACTSAAACKGAAAGAVVRAMAMHAAAEEVQAAGCAALRNIHIGGRASSARRYDVAACVRSVLATLRAFAEHAELQCTALHALITLLAAGPDTIDNVAVAAAVQLDAATAVAAAQRTHAAHEHVPMLAARVLAALQRGAASAATLPTACEWPGCESAGGLRLQRCGACRVARYCSRACQLQHWEAHKPACRAARHRAAAAKNADHYARA
jgi:hypothetical protein